MSEPLSVTSSDESPTRTGESLRRELPQRGGEAATGAPAVERKSQAGREPLTSDDLVSDLYRAAIVVDKNGITKSRAKYADLLRAAGRRITALEAGEYICQRCGIRKDARNAGVPPYGF